MHRRRFLESAAASAAVIATCGWNRSEEPNSEETRFEVAVGVRQLFLDDVEIERLEGMQCVVNQPKRHPKNPLLSPGTSWGRGCQVYGTAYYDEAARHLFHLLRREGLCDR